MAHVAPQFSNDDDLNNEQNVVNYNSNIPCISTEEMDRVEVRPNMEDTGRRRVSFEYNQILRENGFPFENEADLEKSRNLIKLSYFPHSVDVHSNMKRSGPKESMELHNFIETRTKIKLENNPERKKDLIETPTDIITTIQNGNLEDARIVQPKTNTFDDLSTDQNSLKTEQGDDSAKIAAEKISATRSLKTNFILILMFFLSNLFLLLPSKMWQTYFCLLETSTYKSLLPIVTTIANFGTVRSVGFQLWKIIFKK